MGAWGPRRCRWVLALGVAGLARPASAQGLPESPASPPAPLPPPETQPPAAPASPAQTQAPPPETQPADTQPADTQPPAPGTRPPPAPTQPPPSAPPSAPTTSGPARAAPGYNAAEYPAYDPYRRCLADAYARGFDPAWCGGPGAPDAASAGPAPKTPRVHDGFFLRLGLYGGYASESSLHSAHDGDGLGTSFEALFGGTPGSGWVIGGGIFHLGAAPDDPLEALFRVSSEFGLGPFVQWYPEPTGGLNFQLMPGFMDTPGDSGGFISGGLGYDAWVGDEWSVGAFARYLHVRSDSDDTFVGDYRAHYGLFGFVATLH